MSLNTPRTRRVSDGVTSGKRGRPESLVRQYWEDIDADGVGPKCVFCDHRSVTRVFRAPPATRHTLICKNAPEHVKARLRRVTNNKYSRRAPPQQDPSVAAAAAAAAAVRVVNGGPPDNQQSHHQVSHALPHPPPVPQHLEQPPHAVSQPQPSHVPSQPTHQSPPQQPGSQQQQPQFSFKPPTGAPDPTHQDPGINMASPRHIPTGIVTGINASPAALHTTAMESVVPMRNALLNDRSRGVTHVDALSPRTTDILYASNQRMLHEELPGGLDRANAALAAAVIEALFSGPHRKKDGPVPTPAEFRTALQDEKEYARNKAKRQRNEARATSARLQNAISMLVGSRSSAGRGVEVESDDSDDELGQVASGRRGEWPNGFDRK